MDPFIGWYVQRENRGKMHYIDSTIASAAITRCGRRMEPEASRGRLTFIRPDYRQAYRQDYCSVCF